MIFKKKTYSNSSAPEYLIVGLGNPGKQYEITRHNAGFLFMDMLSEKLNVKINKIKYKSVIGEADIAGHRCILMKPQTFMNLSGEAVREACSFYKIPPENVIVLHDEISFDPGIIRIRRRGSAGGHNGLKSIIAHLSSEEFPRIKIGVGKKPTPEYDLADWVLGKFPEADMKAMAERFADIAGATEEIIKGNIDSAMNKYSK